MQRLKLLVGVMSGLIVIALCLAIYGLTREAKKLTTAHEVQPVVLEQGASIKQMSEYDDYLALHISSKHKERILLVDPYSGDVIHTLPIEYKK